VDKLWKTPFYLWINIWITCACLVEKKAKQSYPQKSTHLIHGLIHRVIHKKNWILLIDNKGFGKITCSKRTTLLTTVYIK